jgi:hypothetical protein
MRDQWATSSSESEKPTVSLLLDYITCLMLLKEKLKQSESTEYDSCLIWAFDEYTSMMEPGDDLNLNRLYTVLCLDAPVPALSEKAIEVFTQIVAQK